MREIFKDKSVWLIDKNTGYGCPISTLYVKDCKHYFLVFIFLFAPPVPQNTYTLIPAGYEHSNNFKNQLSGHQSSSFGSYRHRHAIASIRLSDVITESHSFKYSSISPYVLLITLHWSGNSASLNRRTRKHIAIEQFLVSRIANVKWCIDSLNLHEVIFCLLHTMPTLCTLHVLIDYPWHPRLRCLKPPLATPTLHFIGALFRETVLEPLGVLHVASLICNIQFFNGKLYLDFSELCSLFFFLRTERLPLYLKLGLSKINGAMKLIQLVIKS